MDASVKDSLAAGEIERRTIPSEATLEYRDDGKTPVIVGYAAIFGSESRNLGGFVEVLEPRAFDKVLKTNPDVVCVWNHNKDAPLGRVADGRLRLSVDPRGLRYEVTPDTETSVGRDVSIWVKNRTVQASSFAFAVNRNGGESWEPGPNGLRLRRIHEVALLDDVSPVLRPAYDDTSVVVSRRALEMAAGEANRPNQTMSNAAKRGLKVAAGRSDIDVVALALGERISERQIITTDEIPWAMARLEACLEARAATWVGTTAWIEYQLLGGDSGERWLRRRAECGGNPAVIPASRANDGEPAEERADGVDLRPTAAMAAAARRGLKLHEEGRSGDGLKPETVARAKRIAARETLTPSHVREMRAWFRRHKVDRRPGWDKPGSESPGFTAWCLWGAAPAWRWAEAKVAQMERAAAERSLPSDPEALAAFAETAEENRFWTAQAMAEDPEYREDDEMAHPEKIAALYRSLAEIEEKYGPWSRDDESYMAASPYCGRGMYCRMSMSPLDDDEDEEESDGGQMKPNVALDVRSDDEPKGDDAPPPAEQSPQQREDSDVIAAIAAMDAAVLATHLQGADSK